MEDGPVSAKGCCHVGLSLERAGVGRAFVARVDWEVKVMVFFFRRPWF